MAKEEICWDEWHVSKVCTVGGWSFVYPLDPEEGGSGPASQKLPGSIDILAGAPDRLHFLAFTRNEKFKCEKQDRGLSFAGARMPPVQPGVSLRVEWPRAPGVAHVSRTGARAACQPQNRACHIAFSSLICHISGWLGWGRIKMWFSCCWELGQLWKGRAG